MNIPKELLITQLRDKKSPRELFRHAAEQLSRLIAQEALNLLAIESYQVDTPLEKTTGIRFNKEVILIPILRSGITMLPAFLDYFPQAAILQRCP